MVSRNGSKADAGLVSRGSLAERVTGEQIVQASTKIVSGAFSVLLFAIIGQWTFSAPSQAPDDPSLVKSSQGLVAMEGTEFHELEGMFESVGNRVYFLTNVNGSEVSLCCTENLMLQRVYDVLQKQVSKKTWKISAISTEYRGETFLTVRDARRNSSNRTADLRSPRR